MVSQKAVFVLFAVVALGLLSWDGSVSVNWFTWAGG